MKALLILTALFSSISYAGGGNETKNGGEGYFCHNDQGVYQSVEVVDYAEARRTGLLIDLGPSNLNYQEKIKLVIGRLSEFNENLSVILSEGLKFFEKNHGFLPQMFFDILGDATHSLNDKNCLYVALAFQERSSDQTRIWLNSNYWNYLSEDDKAGLIMHEILYKFAIEHWGEESSDFVREITAQASTLEPGAQVFTFISQSIKSQD